VDLEDELLKHDSVKEIAVIAIEDPRWQERPLAIVSAKSGTDIDALPECLRAFLLNRVAKFWVPEYWAFVDEIPKTSVGKLNKKLLREQLAAGALAVEEQKSFGGDDG
jgi:fatty-acyl-CoA synthase